MQRWDSLSDMGHQTSKTEWKIRRLQQENATKEQWSVCAKHVDMVILKRVYFWAYLQLDCSPTTHTQKPIPEQTRRVTTISRPPLESSWRGGLISFEYNFVWSILTSSFKMTFQKMPEQKYTQKNRIRLVNYSCTVVLGSQVLLRCLGLFGKLFFYLFQEVKLICKSKTG